MKACYICNHDQIKDQGLMNIFNKRNNYFYYREKRGHSYNLGEFKLFFMDSYNKVLFALFLPFATILNHYYIFFRKQGGVITVVYSKRSQV